MYHTQFGLHRRLFDEGVAADTAVFRNRQHTDLVEQLKLAFASSTSVVVLRGPAGVGKSTLTSAALRASSTRLALAWLNGTPTNAAELLELLLVELGVDTARTSRIERLQLWRQFQSEMAATVSRLFVVVERTEDLPVEVLHALDAATAADAVGHPGANVVLLGHAHIEEHLAAPVLDSFRQRIRLRAELKPFTEAELQDYLRHRVAAAGGEHDRVFALGAVAALYRHSRGVARLTNNLCEMALTLAASRGQKLLTVDLVNEAAVTWLGLGEPQPIAAPPVANTTSVAAKPVAAAAPLAVAPSVAPTAFTASVAPVASVAPPITVTVAPPVALAPAAPSVVTAPAPVAPIVPAAPVTAAAPVAPPRTVVVTAPVAPPRPAAPVAAAPTIVSSPRAAAAPSVISAPSAPAAPIASAAVAPPAPRVAPAPAIAQEYDGGETDIPDVSIVDFPVLTDAVDIVEPSAPAPIAAAAPTKPAPKAPAAPTPPLAPPRVATPPAPVAARPTPAPAAPTPPLAPPRVETAYAAQRAAAPSKPATPAAPPPKLAPAAASAKPAAAAPVKPVAPSAPPKPPAPRAVEPPSEDDVLRQTQTMRAISEATSIVDISDSMAETLFGDAELDFLSTSLATETAPTPTPAPTPVAKAQPKPAKAAPSDDDDLIDLLGLSDAPLELIDDSAQPPADPGRKSGVSR